MITDDRKRFFDVLRGKLVPELRADGFHGSGTNYRRFRDPVIQVINVQGSRHGGSCCVNFGIHLSFLPVAGMTEMPDPKKLIEMACEFRCRMAPPGLGDQWWSYGMDDASAAASAEKLVDLYRERGRAYLDKWLDFPGPYAAIGVDDLERNYDSLPGAPSAVRAALAFARINSHLKDSAKARQFAIFGLNHIGGASALQRELEELARLNERGV